MKKRFFILTLTAVLLSALWLCAGAEHTHDWQATGYGFAGVPPMCFTKAVCGICGQEYGEPLGHKWQSDGAGKHSCINPGCDFPGPDDCSGDAATCTAAQVCKDCGYEMAAALGHKWHANGDGTHSCENKGCDYQNIPCSGGAATCVKKAICDICAAEYGALAPHTPVADAAVAPMCESSGLTEGSHCSVCETVLKAQEAVAPLGHKWHANGDGTHSCENKGCDYQNIPCSGGAATCQKKAICDVCAAEYGALAPHTPVADAAVAPTCESSGLTEGSHCSVCETVLKAQAAIFKLGHKWKATGNGTHFCTRAGCGQNNIPCSGGTATCEKRAICDACKSLYGELAAHDYHAAETVAPKCHEQGYTLYRCSVCEATEQRDIVKGLAHWFVDASEWEQITGEGGMPYHKKACRREGCDYVLTEPCTMVKQQDGTYLCFGCGYSVGMTFDMQKYLTLLVSELKGTVKDAALLTNLDTLFSRMDYAQPLSGTVTLYDEGAQISDSLDPKADVTRQKASAFLSKFIDGKVISVINVFFEEDSVVQPLVNGVEVKFQVTNQDILAAIKSGDYVVAVNTGDAAELLNSADIIMGEDPEFVEYGGKEYFSFAYGDSGDKDVPKQGLVFDGVWRYYQDGKMVTGWVAYEGNLYLMDEDGVMQFRWAQYGGDLYYFGSDGTMKTGWQKVGEDRYYLGSDGKMQTGWAKIDGATYYFYADGKMAVNTMIEGYTLGADGKLIDESAPGDEDEAPDEDKGDPVDGEKVPPDDEADPSGDEDEAPDEDKGDPVGGEEVPPDDEADPSGDEENPVGGEADLPHGWLCENGLWYYYQNGVKMTAWITENGKWYYLGAEGAMFTGGLMMDSGDWFYMGKDGAMRTGWVKVGADFFYFKPDGKMARNTTVDGFRVGADGKLIGGGKPTAYENEASNGWARDGAATYYYINNTKQTGFVRDKGNWYYFGADGAMQTSWTKIAGDWYYFGADGVMQTGMKMIDGKQYFFNTDGTMKTSWMKIAGDWYYFGADGAMQTGWVYNGIANYYFYKDGKMARNTSVDGFRVGGDGRLIGDGNPTVKEPENTGKWTEENGKRYYYVGNVKQTGLKTIDGKQYYFGTDGAMQTGLVVLNGRQAVFGADGAMLSDWQTVSGAMNENVGINIPTTQNKNVSQTDENQSDAPENENVAVARANVRDIYAVSLVIGGGIGAQAQGELDDTKTVMLIERDDSADMYTHRWIDAMIGSDVDYGLDIGEGDDAGNVVGDVPFQKGIDGNEGAIFNADVGASTPNGTTASGDASSGALNPVAQPCRVITTVLENDNTLVISIGSATAAKLDAVRRTIPTENNTVSAGETGDGGEGEETEAPIIMGMSTVAADLLFVRSGPGTSYEHIGTLNRGDRFTILGKTGSWCKIECYNGQVGYVSVKYISK